MPLGPEEIRNRWDQHVVSETTKPQHDLIRDTFKFVAATIDDNVPEGRAKALALTNLQQASMWANFAIAEQTPLSEPSPK